MLENKRISLRQIALRLGVSKMTVSRALRGHACVHEPLRRKVLDAARELGYVLDPALSPVMAAFRHGQATPTRETVAFVGTEQNTAYQQQLFSGAAEMAKRLNCKLEMLEPWRKRLSGRQASRILWTRGIRGVLLAPRTHSLHPHYTLDWRHFAPVLLGSSLANHGLARVQFDHFAGAKMMVRKLWHLGYRRIGLLLDRSAHERTNRQIASAFLAWHPDEGASDSMIHHYSYSLNPSAFRKWMKTQRPDCLVVESAEWLEYLRHDFGLEIPGRIGFAAHNTDGRPEMTGLQSAISTMQIGAEAMRLVDALVRDGATGLQPNPLTILVPPQWQAGLTAPARGAAGARGSCRAMRKVPDSEFKVPS